MISRIAALIRKEFMHILRDPRTLAIVILMPTLMLLLYGYAITLDIKLVPMAMVDLEHSQRSRELVEKFTNSGYFEVKETTQRADDVEPLMKRRRVKVGLVIPTEFTRELETGRGARVQVLVDGSNPNVATIIVNYCRSIISSYVMELNQPYLSPPVRLEPRVLYNPNLKSSIFFVPGLAAVILMMISALLTSITVAREKETGTLEQILVSPIRPHEIIIGKTIPFVLLAFVDGAVILGVGKLWFGVPFHGSLALLMALTVTYVYAALGIGVLISTVARTQQVATMFSLIATMLPSFLLSGFIFPIDSMPPILRVITHVVPARYFLVIVRGILLKGIGFEHLWEPTMFLFGFGTLLLMISSVRFKPRLD